MALEVQHQDRVLAYIGSIIEARDKWYFSSMPDQPLQWGLGRFNKGHILQAHVHIPRERIPVHKTQEFVYVVRGSIKVEFFTSDKQFVKDWVLVAGMFVCFYDGGHRLTIANDNTILIEVKNGPYAGTTADKERF